MADLLVVLSVVVFFAVSRALVSFAGRLMSGER